MDVFSKKLLMDGFQLLNIGIIAENVTDKYYQVILLAADKPFQLELNFKHSTIAASKKLLLNDFKNNLESFENNNKKLLENDFFNHGVVESYLDFLCIKGLASLEESIGEKQLTEHLKLIRVAVYPDGNYKEDCYASFAYSLKGDLSCPILTIKTDESGGFKDLNWES